MPVAKMVPGTESPPKQCTQGRARHALCMRSSPAMAQNRIGTPMKSKQALAARQLIETMHGQRRIPRAELIAPLQVQPGRDTLNMKGLTPAAFLSVFSGRFHAETCGKRSNPLIYICRAHVFAFRARCCYGHHENHLEPTGRQHVDLLFSGLRTACIANCLRLVRQ